MNFSRRVFATLAAACLVALAIPSPVRAAETKKIVLVAGTPSHGKGEHEFNAGVQLLKKCLDKVSGVDAHIYLNGWPKEPDAFKDAAAVVLFMDGGNGHPVIKDDHLKVMGDLMARGVGLACLHYAVEVPKEKGGPEYLKWIGGYYETGYSINPHWDADLKIAADHPILRGVKPWKIRDEWYYNMRFAPDPTKVVPLLRATPPDATRGTPAAKAAAGREEILSWEIERADGGRGFGFTGAHFHKNWGDDNFRRYVLNAILWTAKAEVPKDGVASSVSADELAANLDPKR